MLAMKLNMAKRSFYSQNVQNVISSKECYQTPVILWHIACDVPTFVIARIKASDKWINVNESVLSEKIITNKISHSWSILLSFSPPLSLSLSVSLLLPIYRSVHLFIDLFLCVHCLRSFIKAGADITVVSLSSLPPSRSLSLGTLLTGWFKREHYSAGDEIISFLSSTALFPLLMGSPAASEARGERRVLRKKQLASNMRLTLRSCGRGSGCFQHQMISDLGP